MADEPQNPLKQESITIAMGSTIDLRKVRSPYAMVPLPETFLPFLAQIALLWGMFENSFDEFFHAMQSANNTTSPDWRRSKFEQKKKAFQQEAVLLFQSYPAIAALLTAILVDASELQATRNLLLHGDIGVQFSVRTKDGKSVPDVTIFAAGVRKGQPVEGQFNGEKLEILFYDLAHLAGRMGTLKPGPNSVWPPLASTDRSFLQDFLAKHHPSRATVATLQDPPQSSEA